MAYKDEVKQIGHNHPVFRNTVVTAQQPKTEYQEGQGKFRQNLTNLGLESLQTESKVCY